MECIPLLIHCKMLLQLLPANAKYCTFTALTTVNYCESTVLVGFPDVDPTLHLIAISISCSKLIQNTIQFCLTSIAVRLCPTLRKL